MRPNRISATTKNQFEKNRVYTGYSWMKRWKRFLLTYTWQMPFGIETGIDASVLEDEVASRAYLRGAFLSSGSIKDPEKEKYQLEIHSAYTDHAEGNCPSHARIFTRCETIERKKEW